MRGCCQHFRTHRSAPSQTGQSRRSPLKMWWIFFKRARAINQRKLVKNVRLGMTLNVGSNLKLEFIPSNFTFSDFSTKFLNKVLFIFVLPWLLMLSTALSSSMLTLMSRSLSITWTSVSPTNHLNMCIINKSPEHLCHQQIIINQSNIQRTIQNSDSVCVRVCIAKFADDFLSKILLVVVEVGGKIWLLAQKSSCTKSWLEQLRCFSQTCHLEADGWRCCISHNRWNLVVRARIQEYLKF